MRIYKTCCDGNWCAHDELYLAKEMFMSDIEDADGMTDQEFYKHRDAIEKIDDEQLLISSYKAREFVLMIDEMEAHVFYNLPEFEGY